MVRQIICCGSILIVVHLDSVTEVLYSVLAASQAGRQGERMGSLMPIGPKLAACNPS